MARYIGQGHKGDPLKLTLVPSSALKTMLDTAWAANSQITGWKVAFTKSANWEVSHAAANAYFDGVIEEVEKCNGSPYYRLTVDVLTYKDGATNVHTARRLRHEPYSGSAPTLGDGVVAAGTSNYNVKGSSAGGGFVLAIDESVSGYCHILF